MGGKKKSKAKPEKKGCILMACATPAYVKGKEKQKKLGSEAPTTSEKQFNVDVGFIGKKDGRMINRNYRTTGLC